MSNRHDEEGVAAVEAAIVGLLVATLFFGILEFGLIFRTTLTLSSAVRGGARTAVAQPRTPGYEDGVRQAVEGAVSVLGDDQVDEMVIYKADPTTGDPLGGGTPDACIADCWRYVWDPVNDEFIPATGSPSWDALDQNACGGINDTDYVGVWVKGHYNFVTGLFGSDIDLTERMIMRLEPVSSQVQCQP